MLIPVFVAIYFHESVALSLFEAFGLVYIEAMALGKPVIACNHVNQKDIIKKGIFIDMNKKGNLTKAISKINKRVLETSLSKLSSGNNITADKEQATK